LREYLHNGIMDVNLEMSFEKENKKPSIEGFQN
jgi:hypothetical protein